MFLVPPLSSLSLCLSASLAFNPISCPADPLSLSRCPSFHYSHSPLASTGLASVTRSHQCHQDPPVSCTSRPPGTFQTRCPGLSWLFSLHLPSLHGPSRGRYPPLAGSGHSWRGKLQHLSWPPRGRGALVFGASVLGVLQVQALCIKRIGPAWLLSINHASHLRWSV